MSRRTINLDLTPDVRIRSRTVRSILVLMSGVALAPVVYEGTNLSVARWRSLKGPYVHVDTPVLDTIARNVGEAARFFTNFAHDRLHDLPWQSHILIILGFFAFSFGVWILRRA